MKIRAVITETVVLQKEVEFELKYTNPDDQMIEDWAKEVAYEKTIYDGPGHGWISIGGSVNPIEWEVIDE